MLAESKESSVLGVPIHLCNDYAGWVRSRLEQKVGTHIITLNAEMAMLAERDPEFGEIVRSAELVIPDGSGVVLYLRLRNQQQHRCPGIELAGALVESLGCLGDSATVVFYGGAPGVAERAAEFWQQRCPGLKVVFRNGFLSTSEEEEFLNLLRDRQPSLILVGLGVPRQELWIRRHRALCPEATWIGVGGSFDIWSGSKSRAPVWLREIHLEWLYRLYQEPWRWRRMLVLPQFAWRALIAGK
ncbi:WecB/TagA/CpsF family glycosyltransferase [Oscillatoria sp. FACHB-1406]|uniref:WecB/TagA/CpsF family glycosyltransferase n=1 Tax=Oscillatoria sp. FACHB-1406 TaxID=2692846 RepID=UPI001682FFBF|nr:WecB/TagA/CpsF family glycosyltransferase [Oscillatoria sp. FACHB-1406]MBD2580489.1 WecB/TagA/CpsF family glycosyltransferase [Oscillatoria sp. FACHB-1406]